MAVLSVAEILSGPTLGLMSGLADLLVLDIGGRRVVYALNRAENRLVEVSIASDGQLSVVGSLELSGTIPAGTEAVLGFGSFSTGPDFLTISGLAPSDGQHVTLSTTGALSTQQTLAGVGALAHPVGLETGSVPVLISAADGGGLDQYAETGAGYSYVGGLADAADRFLEDVQASIGFLENGNSYIATVSAMANGVNIASVTNSGLTQTGAIGAADTLPISVPMDLAVISRPSETILVVASFGTSSLSTLQIEDGVPSLADHIYDGQTTRLQGASAVTAVSYGDFAFVAAGGAEGGVNLMTILPGGRLIHLDSLAEDETVPLDQVSALASFVSADALNVLVGSANETGLARLTYDLSQTGAVVTASTSGSGAVGTALDDQIIGSVVGEPLNGLSGDDILLDGRGNDILTGGPGADLFVFTADGQTDQVTDFERGIDRFDLSAFDFLYDVAQLNIVPTASGATLSFGNETIFVTTADAAPLTAGDLTTADILNVDRPPFLQIGREIIGTSADEILIGGPGDDTIAGAGGADSIVGGPGIDLLLGGLGDDTLEGGADRDTLIGGSGDDLLWGGDGGDILYGDDWS